MNRTFQNICRQDIDNGEMCYALELCPTNHFQNVGKNEIKHTRYFLTSWNWFKNSENQFKLVIFLKIGTSKGKGSSKGKGGKGDGETEIYKINDFQHVREMNFNFKVLSDMLESVTIHLYLYYSNTNPNCPEDETGRLMCLRDICC